MPAPPKESDDKEEPLGMYLASKAPVEGEFARTTLSTVFRSWLNKGQISLQILGDWAAMAILRVAVCVSLIVMVLGSYLGFATMHEGWKASLHTKTQSIATSHSDPSIEAIKMGVAGLEYLLLAPLSFLILRSLAEYIRDLNRDKQLTAEFEHRLASSPDTVTLEQIQRAMQGSAVSQKTKSSLLDAKALTMGLLFSILATHLVGVLIVDKQRSDLELEAFRSEALVAMLLLLLLAGLFYMLEHLSHNNTRIGSRAAAASERD